MALHPRTLRCIAYHYEGRWVAFCLDLDIAVEAGSFDQAQVVLAEALRSYVQDAMAESEPVRSRLLNRRAPLHVRLLWGWRIFWATVRTGRDHDGTIEFPVACPA
jgi:hypothetical protein